MLKTKDVTLCYKSQRTIYFGTPYKKYNRQESTEDINVGIDCDFTDTCSSLCALCAEFRQGYSTA
jgi:hypothetical protein